VRKRHTRLESSTRETKASEKIPEEKMESIYNHVPVPVETYEKPPMYRSKHNPKGEITYSTFGATGTTQLPGAAKMKKSAAAHMGPAESQRPNPSTFMKAGQKTLAISGRISKPGEHMTSTFTRSMAATKPSVPSRHEKPITGLKSNKNFITHNAVEAILQVPQKPVSDEADYLGKADYGQVPEYLGQVKEEIKRENEMIDQYVAELGNAGRGGSDGDSYADHEEFDENERRDLLRALKGKWDSVNAKYQKMCHMVKLDTVGKIRRKEEMEKELDQIESDIKKLASRSQVLVAPH